MKKLGIILVIIGGVSLLFSIVPDDALVALNFPPNLMRFVNNYLIMIAIHTLFFGVAAWYVGKKYARHLTKSRAE